MKQVSVLVGAGSIGQAIIRRVSAGKHIERSSRRHTKQPPTSVILKNK